MKKCIETRVWNSFEKMLGDPKTQSNYYNYYSALTLWVKNNIKYFDESLLKSSRLDILIKLDPLIYVVEQPDLILNMELNRFKRLEPNEIDIFAMILGDTLWDMVTIYSGKECSNCQSDEFRYLLVENAVTNVEKIVLECDTCGWSENLDGSRLNGEKLIVKPANKFDLARFGVEL